MSGCHQWRCCPRRRHHPRRHWQPKVAPPVEEKEEIVSSNSKERKMAEWMNNEMMGFGKVDDGGDRKDGGEPNKGTLQRLQRTNQALPNSTPPPLTPST